jgi:hypothetical protein
LHYDVVAYKKVSFPNTNCFVSYTPALYLHTYNTILLYIQESLRPHERLTDSRLSSKLE